VQASWDLACCHSFVMIVLSRTKWASFSFMTQMELLLKLCIGARLVRRRGLCEGES